MLIFDHFRDAVSTMVCGIASFAEYQLVVVRIAEVSLQRATTGPCCGAGRLDVAHPGYLATSMQRSQTLRFDVLCGGRVSLGGYVDRSQFSWKPY